MDGEGGGAAAVHHNTRSPEDVFRDFRARRAGIVKALSTDVEKFYQMCDPGEAGSRLGCFFFSLRLCCSYVRVRLCLSSRSDPAVVYGARSGCRLGLRWILKLD